MSAIYSIVYQPKDQEYGERLDDYIRVPLEQARLIAEYGIDGDQKAGHHPQRQLNLLSREWLDGLVSKGYRTQPGQFGEQIIVDGLDVETLHPGDRLQLGDEARIEITKTRTGCVRLETAQGQSIEGIGPIGVLARVVSGGVIRVGDHVSVMQPVETTLPAQTTG